MNHESIIAPMRHWVETVVVGLNLCPFAQRELVNNRVRFFVSDAISEASLLTDLQAELVLLVDDEAMETTLLIHPAVLQNFHDFNQFLNNADALLVAMKLDGVFQIASFHPDYQFGGTEPEDAENYTNRSPYPTLHLIREASLEQAIANYPDVDEIPVRNVARLEQLGAKKMRAMLQACFEVAKH